MNRFFKKILCGVAVFLSCNAPLTLQSTHNIDDLRAFETITQIPDYINKLAGMALLQVIPAYITTLDNQHTPETKRLLDKLFNCPNPELTTKHILPRSGEFQIARFITPKIAGRILALIDFYRANMQKNARNKNQIRPELADKLRQTIACDKLPAETIFLKLNRNFVNAFMKALDECSYFSSDSQNAPLITNFAPQALLAFICLKASDRSSLTDYCVAYQEEKNRLENKETIIEYPAITSAPSKMQNIFVSWNPKKATSITVNFRESLIAFLKSTFQEVAPMIEIPDVTTRGTSYPVCIETLLHCLVQFTLNSQTFKGQANKLSNFFTFSAKDNLEQHIIDFSQLINNLAGVVYEQIVTEQKVIDRTSKQFNVEAEITGFVHLDCPLSEDVIRNFFANRPDLKFIKQQDNIIFISLGDKVLGIYNAEEAYGVAIQALLSNVIICLVKLFEINSELNLSQLIGNTCYEQETFSTLAQFLGWDYRFFSKPNPSEPWSISLSNNKGWIIAHITSCHGFCIQPTVKNRLRGKANTYALDSLRSYYSPGNAQNSDKLLIILNSLAPWDLSRLITTPTSAWNSSQKGGPLAQNGSELPEALARHLYLGQEVNDANCMDSIIDILGHHNGSRLTDVMNFLILQLKSSLLRLKNSLSSNGKDKLQSAINASSWIKEHQELDAKLAELLV